MIDAKWMKIIESQNNSGWKGPKEICRPTSCSKQHQLWDQARLLRALFCLVLKTSKDGDCTTSLGREASNPAVRKQTAKGISARIRGESLFSSPWKEHTSSSFALAFWNKSKSVPADLAELIFTPEETAANFNLETQTSLRLLALVKVVQKGGWLFYKSNSDPVLLI